MLTYALSLLICQHSENMLLATIWTFLRYPNHGWAHPFCPLAGYDLLRADRPNQRGGGVALFIKHSLNAVNFSLGQLEVIDSGLEQLWAMVVINKRKLGVCACYRPPAAPYTSLEALENACCLVQPMVDDIICLGDLNINYLDISSPATKYLQQTLSFCGLRQLISEPTHYTQHVATLIDLLLVSESVKVTGISNSPAQWTSAA